MHSPYYVPASADAPARIYYAGRAARRREGAGSSYAIGVLEEHQGRWVRRAAPILTGRAHRPRVLEPRVLRHGDRYIMWFLAAPHEVAPDEQPDYELRSSTSANGMSGWTTPEVFALSAEGFFDVAPVRTGETWAMVLARGTNLHGTSPYPPKGALTVFVSGTRACRGWSSLTLERPRRFRKPPVPAPFFLSATALRFSDADAPWPG
ncbi:hypothetical protein [Nesterenkonia sp. CF4.4]|uniref:hypothetical protein n=1 Tax=Nesterenkonia sp. CF4.4 TaxID=3373079 RepID=UPI003EE67DEB